MCNNNLKGWGGISVSDPFPDVYKRTLLRSYLKIHIIIIIIYRYMYSDAQKIYSLLLVSN